MTPRTCAICGQTTGKFRYVYPWNSDPIMGAYLCEACDASGAIGPINTPPIVSVPVIENKMTIIEDGATGAKYKKHKKRGKRRMTHGR